VASWTNKDGLTLSGIVFKIESDVEPVLVTTCRANRYVALRFDMFHGTPPYCVDIATVQGCYLGIMNGRDDILPVQA
jgi:hypothetical protein